MLWEIHFLCRLHNEIGSWNVLESSYYFLIHIYDGTKAKHYYITKLWGKKKIKRINVHVHDKNDYYQCIKCYIL